MTRLARNYWRGFNDGIDKLAARLARSDWEPATPTPAEPGLDVERLARAAHRSYDRDPAVRRIEWDDLNASDQAMWRRHARAIAHAYREADR